MDPYYSNIPPADRLRSGAASYYGRSSSVGSFDSQASSSNYSTNYTQQQSLIYNSSRLGPATAKPSKDISHNMFFNTTKNTWDCGLCRKGFKEKKDLEQHLNSGTHDEIKYSCSECGKGFASLGALTLHIEQAGHSNMNKRALQVADARSMAFPSGGSTNLEMTSTGLYMDVGPESFLNSSPLPPPSSQRPSLMRPSHDSVQGPQIGGIGSTGSSRLGGPPLPTRSQGYDAPMYRRAAAPYGESHRDYDPGCGRYPERDPYAGYGGEGEYPRHHSMPSRDRVGYGPGYPPRYGGYEHERGYGPPPPYPIHGNRPDPRDLRGGYHHPGPSHYPNDHMHMPPPIGPGFNPRDNQTFYLTIAGYTEKHLLEAGCCFGLTDESQTTVLEDSFVISQFHTCSLQPEYEALCEGLTKALELGIHNIKVFTATETLFIQLNTGNTLLYCQTVFRSVDPLFIKVKKLCFEFRHIDVELVSKAFLATKTQQAKTTLYEYKFPSDIVIPLGATLASPVTTSNVSSVTVDAQNLKDNKLDPVAAAVTASVTGKNTPTPSIGLPHSTSGFNTKLSDGINRQATTTVNETDTSMELSFDISEFSQLAKLSGPTQGTNKTRYDPLSSSLTQEISAYSMSTILDDDVGDELPVRSHVGDLGSIIRADPLATTTTTTTATANGTDINIGQFSSFQSSGYGLFSFGSITSCSNLNGDDVASGSTSKQI